MKIFNVLIVCFFIAFVSSISFQEDIEGIEFLPNFLPANVSGRKYCPTEDIWKWKSVVRSSSFHFGSPFACATQGNCDNYAERNKWTNKAFDIPLQVQVVCCTSTNCNGITQARVNDQVRQINEDFKSTGFTFSVAQTRFLVNSTYCELPAYSSSSNTWYNNLLAAKRAFAVTPSQYLNVFITAQKAGTQGTLLGIGTFPWDSDSTLSTGGLWVNAAYVKYGDKTASHEIGHNVGLWHTFHGDSEVACSNGCYEVVHQGSSNTDVANTVGDFCADTPAQPMNYNCQYPTGSDCKGNRYTLYGNNPVLINNIMAYTPDSCMQSFTAQQAMRAHCWVCAKLRGYDHNGNHCK